jgi:imidazolonepropionase-like amidohydrolase
MPIRTLALILFLAGTALPQTTTAIRAGHLVDPATGTVAENQIVLVRDGKIAAVGVGLGIPAGSEVIDLSGAWVLPGLMDAHAHLTLHFPTRVSGDLSWAELFTKESSAFRALRGVHTARVVLEAGFTVIRDIGNAAEWADTDMRRAIEAELFPGPTILNAGKIIAPFGGQVDHIVPEQGPFWQFEYIDADSPDEIRKAVRQNIYYGANTIKLVADEYSYFYSEEEIRAAVEEAHQAGVIVGVHAGTDRPTRNAILAGADSIEHGFELSDEVLSLMKDRGTFLVGTDFPLEHLRLLYEEEEALRTSELILDRLRRAHRIGVKMAFGTDVVATLPGKSRADMRLDYLAVWRKAGVPAADILKAMTTNAAELLGIQAERGAIKPGLAADIVATSENPLQDIDGLRTVHFVMKDGVVIRQTK